MEYKKWGVGTSLAVQWLRLCASTARGMSWNPGWGNKIPHAMQPNFIEINKNKIDIYNIKKKEGGAVSQGGPTRMYVRACGSCRAARRVEVVGSGRFRTCSAGGAPWVPTLRAWRASLFSSWVLCCSAVSDSLQPHGLQPTRFLCPWDSPDKNTDWGAMPSTRGSSQSRDQTQVSHIAGRFFTV